MHTLVTGGTGFIGSALVERLRSMDHEVTILTRRRLSDPPGIHYVSSLDEMAVDGEVNAVVNLAGASLGARRWSAAYKEEIVSSRLDTTEAVGGISWSICDPNYDTVLDELGMLAVGLDREFFLSQVPAEDTIDVWVVDDGETIEFTPHVEWIYSGTRNSITFVDYVPDELAEVYIEYEVLSGWQPVDEGDTGI